MCTYLTEQIKVTGSGKGADGWFGLTDASVYFDHPVHAAAEHSLNIDFLNPGQGPSARVAVELTRGVRAGPREGHRGHPGVRPSRPALRGSLALPGARPEPEGRQRFRAERTVLYRYYRVFPAPIGPDCRCRVSVCVHEKEERTATKPVRAARRGDRMRRWTVPAMKFQVERDVLAEAVGWASRALPARPVIPVLSGLLLQAADDGLTLSCFDYEVSARVDVDARDRRARHRARARPAAGGDHPQPAQPAGGVRRRPGGRQPDLRQRVVHARHPARWRSTPTCPSSRTRRAPWTAACSRRPSAR